MNPQELRAQLQRDIPLSQHLGFEIVEATPNRVRLTARLAENINHKGTAFGGSIYTLSVLSAYSLVYTGLEAENIPTKNIVIQSANIEYLHPVTGDFEAVCEFDNQVLYEKFYEGLSRWNKARASFPVKVICKGQVCAQMTGVFVVKK